MSILFKNARLIRPENGTDDIGDLRIEKGFITRNNGAVDQVINCNGQCLSPGIVDVGVKICEPGERHKESFQSAGAAAAAGGVTSVIARPDTSPPIDSLELLEFVTRRAHQDFCVHIKPMATLTKGRSGKVMCEIGFLLDAGAAAFSDCDAVSLDTKVLMRAYSYAKERGALIVAHPQEKSLSSDAVATSGKFATLRGLPAVSAMAERMGLDRDLALVEMTGVAYHADQITTRSALRALKRAKQKGLNVTAGISIHHLTLNELDVADFRSFFKVKPPLRTEEDRSAMVQAVADGDIDIICSMHTPQDEESKRLTFEQAASGAVGLETLLPAALRLYHAGHLSLPQLFKALSLNPARRFGLNCGTLDVGAPADIILFDPNTPFVLDRFKLRSKSKNTPFDGQRLQGRVLASYVDGKQVFKHAEFSA